ncbi:hypothetical protein AMEX_G19566 [Astyanax mexicanus]|uniref:Uncharacterized protein n=1 Tax=Astyanax mexicanus TaxID=7994 RepID=A0A8T2LD93_ASTMX|nr:hypothetical protein AMEX_G19566 [Astyanax mexicanus]
MALHPSELHGEHTKIRGLSMLSLEINSCCLRTSCLIALCPPLTCRSSYFSGYTVLMGLCIPCCWPRNP